MSHYNHFFDRLDGIKSAHQFRHAFSQIKRDEQRLFGLSDVAYKDLVLSFLHLHYQAVQIRAMEEMAQRPALRREFGRSIELLDPAQLPQISGEYLQAEAGLILKAAAQMPNRAAAFVGHGFQFAIAGLGMLYMVMDSSHSGIALGLTTLLAAAVWLAVSEYKTHRRSQRTREVFRELRTRLKVRVGIMRRLHPELATWH